jgi:hypothetical protein
MAMVVEPCGLIVLNSLQGTCGSFRCGGPFRCGALDSEIECQARARLLRTSIRNQVRQIPRVT